MDSSEIASRYDAIAVWWVAQMEGSDYGLSALDRALCFAESREYALDVGCGAEGRFLRKLKAAGFYATGLDVSSRMIELARARLPEFELIHGDIIHWKLPRHYDLITAWDSIFHLEPAMHEPVIAKLCGALTPGGVLLITGGGEELPGTVTGEFGGKQFSYSTPGVRQFLEWIRAGGCALKHLEYDQLPEKHLVLIAKKS